MKLVRPITITDAVLSASNIPEDDFAAWDVAVTYLIGEKVVSGHQVYECVQANTGIALTNTAYWLPAYKTNRWRMFDGSPSSQTEGTGRITVELIPGGGFDTVALMNSVGSRAHITITSGADGVVYNATHSLVSAGAINNWWNYFFDPLTYVSDLVVSNLPIYLDAMLDIEIEHSDLGAKCGELVVGMSTVVGATYYGNTRIGIQDYSIKQVDDWGNYSIVQRAFAKRAEFTFVLEPSMVDELHALLATYRATPIVYVGMGVYSSTIVYGFFKDFHIEIADQRYSVCSISLEGLT